MNKTKNQGELLTDRVIEQSLIGSCLLDPNAIWETGNVPYNAFADLRHKTIWKAMLELASSGTPVDFLLLTSHLESKNELEKVGGAAYITSLIGMIPTAVHANHYAGIVKDLYTRRELQRVGAKIVTIANDQEVAYPVSASMGEIIQMAKNSGGQMSQTSDQAWRDYIEFAGDLKGTPSGFRDLDKIIYGLRSGEMIVIGARPSIGKCLAPGTPVLMFDGTIKQVEEIVIGDRLMGPDSQPRTVKSLTSGIDDMYRITPTKGMSYEVNGDHMLSLVMSGNDPLPSGTIVNISVKDYLKKNKKWMHHAKGYRVPADWTSWPVPIDPYYLGLWLGDGSTNDTRITTADQEIVDYLYEYAKSVGLRLAKEDSKGTRCPSYNVVVAQGAKNPIREDLRELGIFGYKDHIPFIYKVNDRDTRLNLLAGLVDSDGYVKNGHLSIVQKHESLANDIAFLARSLGFCAYVKPIVKKCYNNGKVGKYFDVSIGGNFDQIPTRIPRKQSLYRKLKRDPLRVGIKVHYIGKGGYFGFELDGDDGLFLLGDFTVTHNTAILLNIAQNVSKYGTVLFASVEMTIAAIQNRIISQDTGLTTEQIMEECNREARDMAIANHAADKIIYLGQSGLTTAQLMLEAQRIKLAYPDLRAIFVDYLQLMGDEHDNPVTRVTRISKNLKEIAMSLNVPIVVASQLNRMSESRSDKKPQMSDLRECLAGDMLVLRRDTDERVPIAQLVGTSIIPVWSLDNNLSTAASELHDVHPAGIKQIFKLTTRSGKSIRASSNHPFMKLSGYPGWVRLNKLCLGDFIAALHIGTDMYWDEITSIEPDGKEMTYDGFVPIYHNFIANDFVVHNSGSVEQDSDIVILMYRDMEDNSVLSTPHKVVDLIVAKHRNGPTGSLQLIFHKDRFAYHSIERRIQ